MAYAAARDTRTAFQQPPVPTLLTSLTLLTPFAQTGHCVQPQMRFACMLGWITHAGSGNLDPCGLPALFGPGEKPQALLSIYHFKNISQLNWLRKTRNQRLNSSIFPSFLSFSLSLFYFLHGCPQIANFPFVVQPSAVRFITWADKSI